MARHILPMERWKFVFYAALAFLLLPVFFWKTRRPPLARCPKILVIPIMTRIGDLVCATPVFRTIKEHLSDSHLSVLVAAKALGIVKYNPRIDQLINLNDIPFKGFWGRGRLFYFIGRQRFDWIIALTNNPFNNLVLFYSFAPNRLKTMRAKRSLTEWLTDWLANYHFLYQDGTFLPRHYLAMLRPLGVQETKVVKEVFLTPASQRKADIFLRAAKMTPGDFLVGITVSTGNRAKQWPLERFAKLADALIDQWRAKILFIDAASNQSLVESVRKMMRFGGSKVVATATNFTLEELPSLIKQLKLFVAVDSGSVHIAQALGVPLVDIMGPVHPAELLSSDEKTIKVLPKETITPSIFALAPPGDPRNHQRALTSIQVSDVLEAVKELRGKCDLYTINT